LQHRDEQDAARLPAGLRTAHPGEATGRLRRRPLMRAATR
jgi:hypothetical protein